MVLSNKKLKQKLRTVKAEALVSKVSNGPERDSKKGSLGNPESNSQLQELLEAAKQRQRLSKRGKRRKAQEKKSQFGDNGEDDKKVEDIREGGLLVGEDGDGESSEKKIKRKKRKREEGESEKKGLEEDVEVKVAKKAKKKKKKKTKKKTKAKTEKEKAVGEAEGVVEAAKAAGESKISEDIADKVYVGGIPYYSTEDDIRSFFEGCGTITEVDCMTFPDSGKFRGIAIISFKTEAAAKRALDLDGSDMGGFYLKIQPYKTTKVSKEPNFAPGIVEGYNRIYVGNLSWDITEDDLKKFFSDCKISSIRFGMDKETGEFRGYGHVDFSDNDSLMKALKLDQRIVCGRPIKISCAVPKKGGKFQGNQNQIVEEAKIQSTALPMIPSDEVNNGVPSISSGKIKRRTCYECGEKGHISTACPKKLAADPTDSNTS
ncbi:PREDICTED: 28 kDa ribonucleoprotein, chloroplastic-like [Populus euphratica]|uniref:28 kDa ribonucleoprotein, chloroplastic-like n=1 Tax=Populus euphratica TaxID=75702 RepID=A0AAJ6TRH0_POPEU|nr:PREDICTED: 28 kDa ribonucleoprotein, chloroplastic-like [Populus euphratica]